MTIKCAIITQLPGITSFNHDRSLTCPLSRFDFFYSKPIKKNINIAYNGCQLTGLDSACEFNSLRTFW